MANQYLASGDGTSLFFSGTLDNTRMMDSLKQLKWCGHFFPSGLVSRADNLVPKRLFSKAQ